MFVTAGRGNRPPARCYSLPLLAMLPALAILWRPAKLFPPPPSTNVQFQPRLLFVYGVGITLERHAGSPASLLRSTGLPAASSYRPGDGHGHAALKALRSRETTGVCRKKSLWSGNSAIALRMWRMPTSTICAAVGWGEVG